MVIRSKNRLYIFDRHISDAFLRLLIVAIAVFFGFSSGLMLLRTDRTIDAAFWPRFQNLTADLAGKESTKLGTSEKSIYTVVSEQMEKDGALITEFPAYADKLSPNNQAVEMIRLRLRDLRLVVLTIGFLALGACLFFLLIARIIYGNGQSRFRLVRRLYVLFNHDTHDRQTQSSAHFFSAIQRKVFEVAFAASKGNPDGSFSFDLVKFYKQIWPGDENISEMRRSALSLAFTELCEDYFYFPIPFSQSFLLKAYCPVVPFEEQAERDHVRDLSGRETEVYAGGRFRFAPPLFLEYLRGRYTKLPHQISYGIDDRKNPYAFRIYLHLWERFIDLRQDESKKVIGYNVSIALYDLLENVCFEMSYGHETNLLEQFHTDINSLKDLGVIRSWFIEEHSQKTSHLWYKDAELFLYDATSNTYHINMHLLTHKIYYFELTPTESLDKIKIIRRKCAYLDEFDTPCNRPALPNSPYCKRHAKVLEYDGSRIFHGKVKFLEGPAEETESSESRQRPPRPEEPPEVIIIPPSPEDFATGEDDSEDTEKSGPEITEAPSTGSPDTQGGSDQPAKNGSHRRL